VNGGEVDVRLEFTDKLLNAAAQFGRTEGEEIGWDRGSFGSRGGPARLEGEAHFPDSSVTFAGEPASLPDGGFRVPVTGAPAATPTLGASCSSGPAAT
jgi:hypothetical protein